MLNRWIYGSGSSPLIRPAKGVTGCRRNDSPSVRPWSASSCGRIKNSVHSSLKSISVAGSPRFPATDFRRPISGDKEQQLRKHLIDHPDATLHERLAARR